MSIVIRKVGSREYVYEAHRDGARMVQSYIGPLARPHVRRRVEAAQQATVIPQHTMRLFSGAGPAVPSLSRDAAHIIAIVLEQGDLEDVQWLTRVYPGSTIVDAILAGTGLSSRTRTFWSVWFEVPNAS
jgi:homoserine kinase